LPDWLARTSGGLFAGRAAAFGEGHLEAASQLLVAGGFEGGKGAVVVKELLATQLAATADLPALAQQQPGTEQIRLQDQLDVAGRLAAGRGLLHEQAHPAIVPGLGSLRGSSQPACFMLILGACAVRISAAFWPVEPLQAGKSSEVHPRKFTLSPRWFLPRRLLAAGCAWRRGCGYA